MNSQGGTDPLPGNAPPPRLGDPAVEGAIHLRGYRCDARKPLEELTVVEHPQDGSCSSSGSADSRIEMQRRTHRSQYRHPALQ